MRSFLPFIVLCCVPVLACGKSAHDPFSGADADSPVDAADETDAATSDGPLEEASDDAGHPLGKPCLDDSQCNDELPCTFDSCDPNVFRCVHVPDELSCQNGRYCDGTEVCDLQRGCIAGVPITCSDDNSCTVDRCVEDQKLCAHDPRDADHDGVVDNHCTDGTDCNDLDPHVSSAADELCANGIDDDCDKTIDEPDCVVPANDTCASPLMLALGQETVVPMQGTKLDYAASCVPAGDPSLRDVVAGLELPGPDPVDLLIVARADTGFVGAALATACGDPSTELACGSSGMTTAGTVTQFLARNVAPSTLPLYVYSNVGPSVRIKATARAPTPPPANETCGTATPITPGTPFTAELIGVAFDLPSACSANLGDLVYSFTTSAPADVYVTADSVDGIGMPMLSLRDAACALASNELTCQMATSPVLFHHSIPAGTWYVGVSSNAPTTVIANVQLTPPTTAPPDENCTTAPPLAPNTTISVPLAGHADDVAGTCIWNSVDAAYSLTLNETSDVLLVGRLSQGDYGAVSLFGAECNPSGLVTCAYSSPSPIRTSAHNQAAGEYHAVIETMQGNPTQFTAFVRPALPPTLVVFADSCTDAVTIPETGGFFQGNTLNATPQIEGSCDQGGQNTPGGAPEQVLRLQLSAQHRVVFDMRGSQYRTLLDVRKGPSCPGDPMLQSCAAGYYEQHSFLDLTLDAGMYYVIVDGYYGESGPWYLDVFVTEP